MRISDPGVMLVTAFTSRWLTGP